jgi:hypothetical protein
MSEPTPETTRRVSVTLTFVTDDNPNHVLDLVTGRLIHTQMPIEGAHVHAFDLAEPEQPEPVVHLVVVGAGVAPFIGNPNGAHAYAEEIGGVVVELPVSIDCRTEETP